METTITTPKVREFFARVNGEEFCVSVKYVNADTYREHPYWWVEVGLYQPGLSWYKPVFSESASACDREDEHQAMREAFKRQRSRMREWIRSWQMHRESAAAEKGGKRGYYTKWANKAHACALEYAPKWKLAKAIWKEITKL
jgi:hypothetical protein